MEDTTTAMQVWDKELISDWFQKTADIIFQHPQTLRACHKAEDVRKHLDMLETHAGLVAEDMERVQYINDVDRLMDMHSLISALMMLDQLIRQTNAKLVQRTGFEAEMSNRKIRREIEKHADRHRYHIEYFD